MQSAPDRAESSRADSKKRNVTISKLTEGLGLIQVGIRMFEDIDMNEERVATIGRELLGCILPMRRF
jgi:hypothetical protein